MIKFDVGIEVANWQSVNHKTSLANFVGVVKFKDGLYAGYCGAIPIPGYWYSIGVSQKSSIPYTSPIPKFYCRRSNQKQRNNTKNTLTITYY